MPKVAIVTDSGASIPEALIEALNIHWVPYYFHRGTEVLRDLVEARRDCVEALTAELSPALGVHTGPGTAGLCYFPVATQT